MSRIPIRITAGFFVTAALLGFINSFSLFGTMLWIGVIFISVLVHELGHALTALLFGQQVRIELIAFGGMTIPSGKKLAAWKEFLVILMGPLFGFGLFVVATLLIYLPVVNPIAQEVLKTVRFVNLFWTVVNLFPMLPLDGGQLVRVVLEAIFGARGWKMALYVSVVCATLFAVIFFLMGLFLLGAIFLLFGFQSVETIRLFRNYTESDQDETNRVLLQQAEGFIKIGQEEQALRVLDELGIRAKRGVLYTVAQQYRAKIFYQHQEFQKAYDMLLSVEKYLQGEYTCMFCFASYEVEQYEKVIAHIGRCFQEQKTARVALLAAKSHAKIHDLKRALAWLKTARSLGGIDLKEATAHPAFDAIRNEKSFQQLVDTDH